MSSLWEAFQSHLTYDTLWLNFMVVINRRYWPITMGIHLKNLYLENVTVFFSKFPFLYIGFDVPLGFISQLQ